MNDHPVIGLCSLIVVLSFCFLAVRQNVSISSDLFAAFVSSIVTYTLTRGITKDCKVFEKLPLIQDKKD